MTFKSSVYGISIDTRKMLLNIGNDFGIEIPHRFNGEVRGFLEEYIRHVDIPRTAFKVSDGPTGSGAV
jgi:hypothetical protein